MRFLVDSNSLLRRPRAGHGAQRRGVCSSFIASLRSPRSRQRQHLQAASSMARLMARFVVAPGPAQHPGRDLVLVAGMADAEPQAMELAVPELRDGVAQAVLAAVAAVELEPRRARRQVQFVVRDQALSGSIFQ
jgi:hypothetical protein